MLLVVLVVMVMLVVRVVLSLVLMLVVIVMVAMTDHRRNAVATRVTGIMALKFWVMLTVRDVALRLQES